MEKKTFLKIFKNKNFLYLWGTQVLSQVTAYLLNFVLMVKIFEATNSTTALSLFLLIYMVPSIFIGLFAGAFIDLWSKRKVLLWTNLTQAFIVLLYLGINNTIWPIYTIVLLYSLCDEFFGPAQAASIPAFVEKENLPFTNSLLLFTSQGSIFLGTTLGSPLVSYFGFHTPFLIASFLLLLGAVLASRLPVDPPPQKKAAGFEKQAHQIIKDIGEGYRFIRAHPRVFYPFLFHLLAQVSTGISIVLFPSLARDLLRIRIATAGLAVFLPVGLGAVIGGLYISKKIKSWGRKLLISLGWILVGSCFLTISLFLPRVGSPALIAFPVFMLLGAGGVWVIITSVTMIQENTPEEIRGRVFGTLHASVIIGSFLPVFFIAAITDFFGVMTTLFLIGLALLSIGLISFRIDRKYVFKTRHRS